MPKESPTDKKVGAPTHFAPSVPDPAQSNPFVYTQLMELAAAFARVEQKVDTLETTVGKLDDSVDGLKHSASIVKGAIIVVGVIFTIALAVIGWAVAGDFKIVSGQ